MSNSSSKRCSPTVIVGSSVEANAVGNWEGSMTTHSGGNEKNITTTSSDGVEEGNATTHLAWLATPHDYTTQNVVDSSKKNNTTQNDGIIDK